MDGPAPVERDSRGILDPWLLRQRVAFTRHPPTPPLYGLVDRFWAVRWDLPIGTAHRQEVLTHPSVNLSVGTPDARGRRTDPEARVTGVATDLVDRELAGNGWTVAAMTTVGGFGAFVPGPVSSLVDRVVDVDVVPGLDGGSLVTAVTTAGGDAGTDDAAREPARVAVLARALEEVLAAADPARVEQAREVAAVARIAETDRGLRRLDDLAARAGVAPRALQRLFARHAGVSPTWVLRRYRLLEAAEAVREGERVVWSDVASALGYADQAHLVRDFRAALGRTPEAYARALR
ncbi:AraC family transcriptional regulator [Actinomycetospora sp. TBRC 11914]|uniref:helix-turn-helix domain-containing protein n=1 Tax=Actinomycetospora sp. TBRC 11914 TaxID=2729387 RepID=UPI00145F3654|nr:AraC family transcriptional regulator [Actinomycetospora sp. TBRC 11914]NMO91932.1 helix-turn-helix transcriptional regulator [Actinomycetospora sp. TBRC 11914]